MCGIIGFFHEPYAFSKMQKGLFLLKERGRDRSGYYDGNCFYAQSADMLPPSLSEHIVGHNLHAIVNTVPQPLVFQKGILVTNCEIYNWKELQEHYRISARNDAELLLKLFVQIGVEKTLPLLRGVYAFAYWEGDFVYLARDILGIKPLWYSHEGKKFAFCSEKKALEKIVTELNPRQLLRYSLKTGRISIRRRPFFALKKELHTELLPQLKKELIEAVRIRIPEHTFGLLFSGGLDSLLLAKILQDLGCSFYCYTAAAHNDCADLLSAQDAAKRLQLSLTSIIVPPEKTYHYLQKIVPLIEDSNVVKVGVALPLFVASERAQEDGNKVLFSGSGADELFGGYHRYTNSPLHKLNTDCYSDLLKIYERNGYRDDVVTMHNALELRVPFLDTKLVAFALRIPPELKIKDGEEKYILRQLALDLGIPRDLAQRKKKAAQYGSGFHQTLEKLAQREKKTKSAYLRQFYQPHNLRLAALVSGGKDSLYASYIMAQQNYALSCLITLQSTNLSSYMFHTPNIHLVHLQAEAMGIPLLVQETQGEKEEELQDLYKVLKKAQKQYHIEGVVSGALYSQYQRERIEKVADRLGLKIFAPLWHKNPEEELRELIHLGFEIILSSIAAEGLDASWLGRVLTLHDVEKLVALHTRVGLHVAFEGGEAESLVLNCPLFRKRIVITKGEKNMENSCTGLYHVQEAYLE